MSAPEDLAAMVPQVVAEDGPRIAAASDAGAVIPDNTQEDTQERNVVTTLSDTITTDVPSELREVMSGELRPADQMICNLPKRHAHQVQAVKLLAQIVDDDLPDLNWTVVVAPLPTLIASAKTGPLTAASVHAILTAYAEYFGTEVDLSEIRDKAGYRTTLMVRAERDGIQISIYGHIYPESQG